MTQLCPDYGWINENIFFNPDMVCGTVPVNVGMNIIALVEEDKTTHTVKTIKVSLSLLRFSHSNGSLIFPLGLRQATLWP